MSDENINIIGEGLRKAFNLKCKKDYITSWYDKKIKGLRENGLSDAADNWEKLKQSALKLEDLK